jgi:Protein of unknown function (DUF1501)
MDLDRLRPSFDPLTRRSFVGGLGAALAAGLLPGSALASALTSARTRVDGRRPAKAKSCIFLFMNGGPSQMDLFDHKPELQRRHGQSLRVEQRRGDFKEAMILGSQRKFARHGATAQWCSDALPRLSAHMDKLAVIKSLYADSFAHGTALLQMNSGQILQGHPSIGAWLLHGLGSPNAELPGYVVMHDPRGGPISGPVNWGAGYMPAKFQGTLFRASGDPLLDLSSAPHGGVRALMSRELERQQVEFVRALDRLHMAARPNDTDLEAREVSYGLAHRLGDSAREALDLSKESERTRELYALDAPRGDHPLSIGPAPFGRQCLIARRLIERGVRFVQIYHGGGHMQQTWDAHLGVEENLRVHAPEIDQPIAGLLTDLAERGLLEETLVVWGGEFGRMPVAQQASQFQTACVDGRDHNPKGFTMWLAGAGVRPGPIGETDELGSEAVVDRHPLRDLHATILHLMGLDHHALTYSWGGLDRKLTGVLDSNPIEAAIA